MATPTKKAKPTEEPCVVTSNSERHPPALLVDLIAGASALTLVADAADTRLPVVATNVAARARLEGGAPDATLADWLGEETAHTIAASIKRNDSVGVIGGWRWLIAVIDAHRWLICDLFERPADHLFSAPIRSENDQRLIETYEAALAVGSELELGTVLQRIVEVARQVVPARYAALGVVDEHGAIVEFITSGITPEERAALGPIPQGHGLLGALITDGKPLLVPDITADPRSVGFPPHHPPMRTLLGIPIKLRNRVLGDLYLTERATNTPFTEHDLETIAVLATHAATAIERAELYEAVRLSRQQAEEQRDQLQSILDNLPSAVIILTPPDGAIELANDSAKHLIFGDDAPAGITLKNVRDYRLLDADGIPLPYDLRPSIRALHDLVVRNQQLLLERDDGRQIPILVQATPLHDAQGKVNRAVLVFQDITRLREAEQLKDDFLSLVSHEFRTPLTAIQGGAHILAGQADSLDAETRQGLLADIGIESERLDRMLHNMLSLAAIMAGRLTAATEPVLIAPLVRGVTKEVAARSPHHAFIVDLPPALPPIEADPDLLGQVLRNLYENAVKYAPNGGEVRTIGERNDTTVCIRVRDQGIGIAAEHVGHVFERFRRPGADPTFRGMGLGLYLSRLLVEAQGGTIRASSAGPGQGASFVVTLPIAEGWDPRHPEG